MRSSLVRWFQVLVVALVVSLQTVDAGDAPPNVIVVLLDDAGYSDFGFMGAEIATPHMDRLAREGVLLLQFYNNAQCVPTRGALLHGMSAHGAGYGSMATRGVVDSDSAYRPLRKGVWSIAEVLRAAGYRTYASGKWHLGESPGLRPLERGFDRHYGMLAGAAQFHGSALTEEKVKREGWQLDGRDLTRADFPDGFYTTDALTEWAMRFIAEGEADRPFFLYLAYTAPHWPLQAKEADLARYRSLYATTSWQEIRRGRVERQKARGLLAEDAKLPEPWPRSLETDGGEEKRDAEAMATYAAMLDCVDQNLGRILAFLEERAQLENTLILLLSDNGADTLHGDGWVQVNNAPFRLMKTFTHEGGVRTPLVAHWPRGLPRGVVNRQHYGHVQDILPTILEATGARLPAVNPRGQPTRPLEGRSLLPALRDPAYADPRPLPIERMGNEMIRVGRWKLVRRYNHAMEAKARRALFFTEGPREGVWELYDLAVDPAETQDLAAAFPEKVAELEADYRDWMRRVGAEDREAQLQRGDAPHN